jgi:glycosyltransferase involved in cell wall biosynthesis
MMRGERVIAVSEAIHQYILANYPKTECARIRLIPRGVDQAEFPHGYQPPSAWLNAWNEKFPQLTGKRVLTLPGRLTRLKGHDDFIDLIGHMKSRGLPVHGLIVGGESPKRKGYARYLREKVAKNHLQDAITFTGQRADLREVMAVSDIVFSLSSQPESFGRTTLEALSLGVPVIGYDHGGVREILESMFPRGLVMLNDQCALVEKVVELLSEHIVVEPAGHFLLSAMLDRTMAVYREFFANKANG